MSNSKVDSLEQYYRYKNVIENVKDTIWEMDTNLVFTYVSPAAKDMSGYEACEMVGRCMLDFLTEESRECVLYQWKQKVQDRVAGDSSEIDLYDIRFICKDKKVLWVSVSVKPVFKEKVFTGYIGTTRDISQKKLFENELRKYNEELESANRKLEELAIFDMLTGVYNRRKFEYYIGLSIDMKKMHGSPFSIIMFDIDGFKRTNDIYGHNKGDQILKKISAIVKATIRQEDKLFRWGGDEFIILVPGAALGEAYKVAEKVRNLIESYNFEIQDDKATISLGVGEHKEGETIDQFVSRVDDALLKAKSSGRNKIEFGL